MKKPESETISLLLVEDDPSLAMFTEEELTTNGYNVSVTQSLKQAHHLLRNNLPDVVVSDLRLPDGTGDSLIETARELPLPPPVVLITAFGQVDDAVSALRKGAADFLTKPLDMDHLLLRLERITEVQRLRAMLRHQKQQQNKSPEQQQNLKLGVSPAWLQIEKQLHRIALTHDPVLITGPSGSGKEIIARSLHGISPRKDRPFIPVNCSGLPEHLLESELFGHTAGAFTGANKSRKGLFAAAEGGTLLLDEIGDMPLDMQTKLLRTLQEGTIRPLGSDQERPIDVRILAATHQNLDQLIADGRFRQDLLFRLETFHLHLPPLSERKEDIELLAHHFLRESSAQLGANVQDICEDALRLLHSYAFPGNVRELRNVIRRAVAFSEDTVLRARDLPEKLRLLKHAAPDRVSQGDLVSMETMRRQYASHVLDLCNNNKREAARILNISRHTLYALIK